ncbi:MAG TPA: two-component regulator propeller domain-containing protein [Verrucomicrobiae bacterium]|jgi:signal transduction histidine kinase/ligand-binding sensor domain-containing protein|nr:two-component regulator propeller domain-containing protein [Verrucomicrobiae bacterium]
MNRQIHKLLLFCLLWIAAQTGRAAGSESDLSATSGAMRIWQKADGLPSEVVTTVAQTSNGFLWVGTSAGLVRFDGAKFTEIKLEPVADSNPVYVTALCADSNGGLWIGTQQQGLFQFFQGKLRHFTKEQGLLDDDVTCLALDKKGQLWVGGKVGLNLWTGQAFKRFTEANGLSDEYISSVHVARSGTVWITTRSGMCQYVEGRIIPYDFQAKSQGRSPEYLGAYEDQSGNIWAFGDTYLINLAEGKRFNYFHSSASGSVRIWSLCEGRDGRLWIGTSGRGLLCFEDGRFQPLILGENRWPYDVRSICEDSEGNLWLGTSGGGLLQLRPQSVHVFQAGQGLPAGSTTALALDSRERVFVGLLRSGLFVGEAGRFERVDSAGLAVQNLISSICVARDGTIWAGTLGDGLYGLQNDREIHFTTANGLANDSVLAVSLDGEGTLWTSTAGNGLQYYTNQKMIQLDAATPGLPTAPVTAMIPATAGGLWLGTEEGSILHEDKNKLSAVKLSQNIGARPVLVLHEGEKSRLWIGMDEGGLTCLDHGATIHWNTHNGLPNTTVAGIVEDNANNLWLSTGGGIYRVSRSDVSKALGDPTIPLECKLVSESKTLPEPATAFCGTRSVRSPEGILWFATSEGVLKVDPHQSETVAAAIPLYLETATFNGQTPISLLEGGMWMPAPTNDPVVRAPMHLRSLEIRFTALDFTAPSEVRFRHRLDGFDSDWVDDGSARSARYSRLPYGDYRFRVAIRDPDGEWQEAQRTFAFIVPTPLYFQVWAICLYVLAVVAVIVQIVRVVSHRRLRITLATLEQQQSVERERMRIARDLHDEIGSKLAKISFLSEHAQVAAEATGPLGTKIASIAHTTRELLRTMDEIVWVVNPHNDTLENLVTYLSHYAAEYFQNTSIQCEVQLPREMPNHLLSSEARHNLFLTFEEALNNVLTHSGATNVKIDMTVKALECEITVTDNGRGFDAQNVSPSSNGKRGKRGGNGLVNMRQRLADIGGECRIVSTPGAGTSVKIHVRLNSKISGKP